MHRTTAPPASDKNERPGGLVMEGRSEADPIVYVVDDDADVREGLESLL